VEAPRLGNRVRGRDPRRRGMPGGVEVGRERCGERRHPLDRRRHMTKKPRVRTGGGLTTERP
jgi:hypothetical protein